MNHRFPSEAVAHMLPGYRLHWEPAEHAYVLLYPEGMVILDQCAADVLNRCDGSMTVEDIIHDVKKYYPGVDVTIRILQLLETAENKGWVSIS